MVLNYVDELDTENLNQIINLFLINLNSSLQSVRQGAAISLSNLLKAFTTFENEAKINEFLELIEKGFNESIELVNINIPETTERVTISFKKAKRGEASCEDDIGLINLNEKSEAWHKSDGYLYIFYEISTINNKRIKTFLIKQFDSILKLLKIRSYSEHVYIMESFCKLVSIV